MLRAHVRSHNISVLAASGAALLFSLIGWAVLYGVAWWVAMFFATIESHGEAWPGADFHFGCAVAFGGTMLLAVVDSFVFPHEEVVDSRGFFGHVFDVVLFIPRISLASLQNFSAWARIPRAAMPHAVRIIERLRKEQRVPLHALPLELPNDRLRNTMLATLGITQIVEMRSEKGELVLRWSPLAPEEFRLVTHDAYDDAAGMRRATVLEKKDTLPGAQEHPALGERHDL